MQTPEDLEEERKMKEIKDWFDEEFNKIDVRKLTFDPNKTYVIGADFTLKED